MGSVEQSDPPRLPVRRHQAPALSRRRKTTQRSAILDRRWGRCIAMRSEARCRSAPPGAGASAGTRHPSSTTCAVGWACLASSLPGARSAVCPFDDEAPTPREGPSAPVLHHHIRPDAAAPEMSDDAIEARSRPRPCLTARGARMRRHGSAPGSIRAVAGDERPWWPVAESSPLRCSSGAEAVGITRTCWMDKNYWQSPDDRSPAVKMRAVEPAQPTATAERRAASIAYAEVRYFPQRSTGKLFGASHSRAVKDRAFAGEGGRASRAIPPFVVVGTNMTR